MGWIILIILSICFISLIAIITTLITNFLIKKIRAKEYFRKINLQHLYEFLKEELE